MGFLGVDVKKTENTTNQFDYSTSTDASTNVDAGGVNIGAGGSQVNYDPAAAMAALEAMSTGNTSALSAMRDNNTVNAWLQLFGLQTAVGAQGKTASEAIGATERISGNATATVASLAGDLMEWLFGNEGKLTEANSENVRQGYLTAQSLGNNAQNLGLASLSAATNLGANAFGAATNLGAQANSTALGMSVRNATMLENLGSGAFSLAESVSADSRDLVQAAFDSSQDTIQQVTDLADSSQSRMADLVTATQSYNTDLAKTAATGGASDLMKTILWIALAGIAAMALRKGK